MADKSGSTKNEIRVPTAELVRVFQTIARFGTGDILADIVMEFQDDEMIVHWHGVEDSIPAENITRPSRVRFPGRYARSIARLTKGDQTTIALQEKSIQIGSLTFPCEVSEAGTQLADLPLDARLNAKAQLRFLHSESEIQESGLMEIVELAEEEIEQILEKAASVLEPVDISYDELRTLWLQKVKSSK